MDSAYEYAMRVGEIFLPTATHRRRAVSPSTRFVHYTTAEAAFEIIDKGRFWMRNVRNMNDYREVQHGYDILHDVFHRVKDDFVSVLDECCDGAAMTAINHFDRQKDHYYLHTYISCISEHHDNEDDFGRLSMWRGYGSGTAAVALVFNASPLLTTGDVGLFGSPVLYFNDSDVLSELRTVINNVRENGDFIKSIDPAILTQILTQMFISLLVAVKHKGFSEELEWRLVYIDGVSSPILEPMSRSVRGAPERLFAIKMESRPDIGLTNIEPQNLLERLIIGPTQRSLGIRFAFEDLFKKKGIPVSKIVASDIPIRTVG